jgi:dolichol kinase
VGGKVIPFNKPKKLGGSLIGVLFAALGASLFVGPLAAVLAAAVAMLVECSPLPVNDNLSIPLVAGLVLMATVGV